MPLISAPIPPAFCCPTPTLPVAPPRTHSHHNVCRHHHHLLPLHHCRRPPLPLCAMKKNYTTPTHQQDDQESSTETKLISILTSRPSHTVSPSDSDFDSIKQHVLNTEQTGGFTTSSIRPLFIGTWTLLGTNARAVIRNNGGLTGFPGSVCSKVQVRLGKDGQAQTTENVSLMFNLIRSRIVLLGKWSIEKRDALHVTYANAVMFDRWRLRADSKAVLKTTYCSKRVRIGRSANDDFYVFVRDEEENSS